MSYIPPVLHRTTWVYFTSRLPSSFIYSPYVVKEAIMTDINDLVQEVWTTSNDGTSFFAMLCLFEFFQKCFDPLVCFVIFSVFAAAVDLEKKNYRHSPSFLSTLPPRILAKPNSETNLRYCLMGIERNLISHFLHVNPKSWVTCSGSYLVL